MYRLSMGLEGTRGWHYAVGLAISGSVTGGGDGRRATVLVEVRRRRHGSGQVGAVGVRVSVGVRVLLNVGMVSAEDRTVWLGGCRRPLGWRRVRHSVDFVWSGSGSNGLNIKDSRALQRRYQLGLTVWVGGQRFVSLVWAEAKLLIRAGDGDMQSLSHANSPACPFIHIYSQKIGEERPAGLLEGKGG